MRTIAEVLNYQIGLMNGREWDTIYVAVDWHDTMMPSTYSNDKYGKYKLYPQAEEVLKWMSDNGNIRLILYTSSHGDQKADFIHNMHHLYGIDFEYHNGNPEVENSKFGCFDEKFYFNVLLDDKAGFDPETDWMDLKNNINKAQSLLDNRYD